MSDLDVADEWEAAFPLPATFPISDEEIAAFFDDAPGEPPGAVTYYGEPWSWAHTAAIAAAIVFAIYFAAAICIFMGDLE